MGVVLLIFVGLGTVQRDNHWFLDAWEHHRAIKALTENFWNPGNPTYLSSAPSIRYGPYVVTCACISLLTGVDPYDLMTGAAIFNMVLLLTGVVILLRSFGEAAAASACLVMILGLYGRVPSYATSFAACDLPWQLVNPSSFAFGLMLLTWASFRHIRESRWRGLSVLVVIIFCPLICIDHVILGYLCQVGLWLQVLFSPSPQRRLLVTTAIISGVVSLVIWVLWPWYSLITILTTRFEGYWLEFWVQRALLGKWCVPAVLCGVAALAFKHRELVRIFLVGGYAVYVMALVSMILCRLIPSSMVLIRTALPALIFFHLPLGVYAHQVGLFRLSAWLARLRDLLSGNRQRVGPAALDAILIGMLCWSFVFQAAAVAQWPHLGRAYLAPLFGKPTRELHLKARYDRLLGSVVGPRDVVLADGHTSWPVPSTAGRIVWAVHPEAFVADHQDRQQAVENFFSPSITDKHRADILHRYEVKWILLNRDKLDEFVFDELLIEVAVVRRDDLLVLMDAHQWLLHQQMLTLPGD